MQSLFDPIHTTRATHFFQMLTENEAEEEGNSMSRSINVLVTSLKDRGVKSVESGGNRKECVVKECVDVGRGRETDGRGCRRRRCR